MLLAGLLFFESRPRFSAHFFVLAFNLLPHEPDGAYAHDKHQQLPGRTSHR
jgi:hypothetical protein